MVPIGRGERVSCKFIGDTAESPVSRWRDCCELAAFFREMIIRHIITGMSLSRPKSISELSCEQISSHTPFPLSPGKQKSAISKKRFSPTTRVRMTYATGVYCISGCESGSNSQHASSLGS